MRFAIIVAVFVVFLAQNVASASKPIHHRGKRVSDQRLAELETLIALSKMNGKLVTVPLGFGKIDPTKIGRKRRSQSVFLDKLFNTRADAEEEDSASNFAPDSDLPGFNNLSDY